MGDFGYYDIANQYIGQMNCRRCRKILVVERMHTYVSHRDLQVPLPVFLAATGGADGPGEEPNDKFDIIKRPNTLLLKCDVSGDRRKISRNIQRV